MRPTRITARRWLSNDGRLIIALADLFATSADYTCAACFSLAREHGQGARQEKSTSSRNRSTLLREPIHHSRSGHFAASFIR